MNKSNIRQLLKPLFFILALIIISAFFIHVLTDSETLSDYANQNPDLAYGSSASHINENKEQYENGDGMETESINSTTKNEINTDDKTHINNNSNNSNSNNDAVNNTSKSNDFQSTNTQGNNENNVASSSERTVYKEGFYYEPLSEEVKTRITGISYPVAESEAAALDIEVFNTFKDNDTLEISYEDLCYLSVLYYDFNGEVQPGELICNKALAEDFMEIFYELYLNEYQIEKIRLVDEYNADDTASITDNNTSCFNYRVVDGTTSLSKHALGCAIDINPFYNPYVVYNKDGSGETYISPPGSEVYVDRSKDFPYKIDENDLCYKLFKAHGFTWGGDWNSCKDYQHFQKTLN